MRRSDAAPRRPIRRALSILLLMLAGTAGAEDQRTLVNMPAMMQTHMLANMRDHLTAIDTILKALNEGRFDAAAEVAEQRLGMSSLDDHGAAHMAPLMPEGMRAAGGQMHRAASRLALRAQEEDAAAAYAALGDVTTACVNCHATYRIR